MFGKIISLLILLLFFFSCSPNKVDDKDFEIIEVFDSKNKDFSINQKVNLRKLISLSVPDSIFFAGCNKAIFFENFIFILDVKTSSIFKFDSTGKYILNFPQAGKGPGEVTDLIDFLIDSKNKEIVLFDRGNGSLIHYDLNANLLSQYRVSPLNRNFAFLNEEIVWFHNNNNDFLNGKLYNITLSNQKGEVLSNYLEFPNENCPATLFGGVFSQRSDGKILCSNGVSNFIYEISANKHIKKLQVSAKYLFHFGQIGMPDDDEEACDFFNRNYMSLSIAYLTKEFYELEDYTYFSYMNRTKIEFGFISISSAKSGGIITSEDFKNNCLKTFLRNPIGVFDNNTLITYLTSEEFNGIDARDFDCFSNKEISEIQSGKTGAILALIEAKN